jgi:hypothetical protein
MKLNPHVDMRYVKWEYINSILELRLVKLDFDTIVYSSTHLFERDVNDDIIL